MSRLTTKDKEALAYFYESEQYESFKKLCSVEQTKIKDRLAVLDMSVTGNDRTVTFLQGQIKALDWLQDALKMHSQKMKKEG